MPTDSTIPNLLWRFDISGMSRFQNSGDEVSSSMNTFWYSLGPPMPLVDSPTWVCVQQQGGSVWSDLLLKKKDITCAIYEFAYHTHEFMT